MQSAPRSFVATRLCAGHICLTHSHILSRNLLPTYTINCNVKVDSCPASPEGISKRAVFLTVAIHATINRTFRPLWPHNGSFNKCFQTAYHISRKAGPRNACLLVLVTLQRFVLFRVIDILNLIQLSSVCLYRNNLGQLLLRCNNNMA